MIYNRLRENYNTMFQKCLMEQWLVRFVYNLEIMGFVFQAWRRTDSPLTPTTTKFEQWWKLNLWTIRPHTPFVDILLLILISWLKEVGVCLLQNLDSTTCYWGFQGGLLKYCPLIRTTSSDGIHEIRRWAIFFQENSAVFTKCGNVPEWHLRAWQKGF